MTLPKIVTRDEWLAEGKELLAGKRGLTPIQSVRELAVPALPLGFPHIVNSSPGGGDPGNGSDHGAARSSSFSSSSQ